jgi:hypothetical protein
VAGEDLVDSILVGQGRFRLGVGGEPERAKGAENPDLLEQPFVFAQDLEKRALPDAGRQVLAALLEGLGRGFQPGQPLVDDRFARFRQQLGEIPAGLFVLSRYNRHIQSSVATLHQQIFDRLDRPVDKKDGL